MAPSVRVVFLSAHIREAYIAAAYQCGACGYFAKSDDLDAIIDGIRRIARGPAHPSESSEFLMGPKVRERCLTPSVSGVRARSRRASSPDRPATPRDALSPRELDVLRLIGKGQSRSEIAQELSRSMKTIDGHQERIMRKLGLHSRAELVRFAIREGLAEV